MTDKQNTLETIKFGKPSRRLGAPAIHGVRYFGVNHESPEDGIGHDRPVGSDWRDIWGTGWNKEHEGVMGFPRFAPLADLAALRDYRWPDPDDERICGPIYAEAAKPRDPDVALLGGSHRDTLWEKSYMLCGMEEMMCRMLAEPEAAREIFHRIMDFQLGIARHYLAVGVEIVSCGDDLGTQCAPILSPELVHEFLVPEYRRLYGLYQQHNVLINFHSCGHIMPLLETFMDLGINVLNPIQASANDLPELRRRTQGRMALHGGLSSKLLVDGPCEAIRAEVARLLQVLGADGGYFCAPDQGMPWPKEHFDAYRSALQEFSV